MNTVMEQFNQTDSKIQTINFIPYVLWAGLVSFVGSYLLVAVTYGLSVFLESDIIEMDRKIESTFTDAFGYIVFAPITETLTIVLACKLYKPERISKYVFCLFPALIAGILHAIIAPISLLGLTFSFYIFTYSYLLWYQKSGWKQGYWAAALSHVVHNAIVVSLSVLPID